MRTLTVGDSGLGVYREGQPVDGPWDIARIPGFIDIHLHGGFGVDFMTSTEAEIVGWLDRLSELGYDACLPSTVSAGADAVKAALKNLPEHPIVAGFHLEGPFISPKYPGAQPLSAIVDPPEGPSEWDEVFDDPRLKLAALAPERPGALALTERLTKRGVTVSMAHTDATYAQVEAAAARGLDHATHTFNAMKGLHHREPGALGYALASDTMGVELIYDRVHVSPAAAKVLVKCAPDRLIGISDATQGAGLPEGTRFAMWGVECFVGADDIRLADGTLAGSKVTLLEVFQNLWSDFGPEVAIRACCLNPRRILGDRPVGKWLEFNPAGERVG
ncbi:N-acetylglucosamine-6-phosphate deacetylase [bacterium]|nr:MAG: N-acetylglucosamine-6-phosphate deacetylase [bacterium]